MFDEDFEDFESMRGAIDEKAPDMFNKIPGTAVAAPSAEPEPSAQEPPAAGTIGLSAPCANDLQSLMKEEGFSPSEFIGGLPAAVMKVKAQEKAAQTPIIGSFLGPGPDGKMLEIGITVGCARTFPEGAGEMQEAVKAAALLIGLDLAGQELGDIGGAKAGTKIDPQIEKEGGGSFWAALALDIAGAGLIAYEVSKNMETERNYDRYYSLSSRADAPQGQIDRAWKKAEDARKTRNIAYIAGAAALTAGIGVHIWF